MANLRILNLSGNLQLTILPSELITCDSLIDIILENTNIIFPPSEVNERGTMAILQFLTTGEINTDEVNDTTQQMKIASNKLIKSEQGQKITTYDEKYLKEKV